MKNRIALWFIRREVHNPRPVMARRIKYTLMMKKLPRLGRRIIEQSFSYQITVDDTAEESKNCLIQKVDSWPEQLETVTTETENYCKLETETILVGETHSC